MATTPLNAASRARLKARIKAMPARAKAAAIKQLKVEAERLVAHMKFVVPVDEHDLQRSIRHYPFVDSRGFVSERVIAGGAITRRVSANGKTYDYARAMEFGTRDLAAQPFFFPTYRRHRTRIRSAVSRAIRKAVKEG